MTEERKERYYLSIFTVSVEMNVSKRIFPESDEAFAAARVNARSLIHASLGGIAGIRIVPERIYELGPKGDIVREERESDE